MEQWLSWPELSQGFGIMQTVRSYSYMYYIYRERHTNTGQWKQFQYVDKKKAFQSYSSHIQTISSPSRRRESWDAPNLTSTESACKAAESTLNITHNIRASTVASQFSFPLHHSGRSILVVHSLRLQQPSQCVMPVGRCELETASWWSAGALW